MRKIKTGIFGIALMLSAVSLAADDCILRYAKPAGLWKESLPIGNGHLGITVFGGVGNERLQLSEHSIYRSGGTAARHLDPLFAEFKKEQRRMALAGNEVEAFALPYEEFKKNWKGEIPELVKVEGFSKPTKPPFGKPAESMLGHLDLFFAPFNEVEKDYERTLDLSTAIAKTTFRIGDVVYTREVFCSYPDDVTVIKVSASEKGKISFNTRLSRPTDLYDGPWLSMVDQMVKEGASRYVDPVTPKMYDDSTIGFTGQAADDGTKFAAALKVLATGGKTEVRDNRIYVDGADEALLVFSASTDYYHSEGWDTFALDQVNKASQKNYDELLKTHLADYQAIFGRVDISLGVTREKDLPTDVRMELINIDERYKSQTLETYKEDRDPGIFALYFQFGRYLLISSSREGYFCPGITYWCPNLIGEWYGGHHDDINHQENYWPADLCNMSETLPAFFDSFEKWLPTARQVAKQTYDSRGIVIAGITPFGMPWHETWWPAGIGWFAQHYWDHYLFNQDKEWLGRQGYPFIKGAALFHLDYLAEDPNTGWLVTYPDWSPENQFIREDGEFGACTIGATMSIAVIRETLTNFIEASKIMGLDEEIRAEAEAALPKLPPFQINQYGGLQEWLKDFEPRFKGHRHLSPLYPVYPGNQISPLTTPDLAEAVKTSLQRRLDYGEGYGYVGWSRGWMLNLYARLYEPQKAHEQAEVLIGKCTYPNMLDTHGMGHRQLDKETHVIDGNFAYTAGIAEMLIQSHLGFVHLLPSLPTENWPNGHLNGIKARGGYEVDIEWKSGKLTRVVIRAKSDGICPVRYGDKLIEFETKAGGVYVLDGNLTVTSQP